MTRITTSGVDHDDNVVLRDLERKDDEHIQTTSSRRYSIVIDDSTKNNAFQSLKREGSFQVRVSFFNLFFWVVRSSQYTVI